MKLKLIVAAVLLSSAFSAQAYTIDYNLNLTDTLGDTFVGSAVYNSIPDQFTSVTGTLTYKDGYVATTSLTPFDRYVYGSTGSNLGLTTGAAWGDGGFDMISQNGGFILFFQNSPGVGNPILTADSFMNNHVYTDATHYLLTSASSVTAVPEPGMIGLFAIGLLGLIRTSRKIA